MPGSLCKSRQLFLLVYALQALEIMIRLISVVQANSRRYPNGFDLKHRLESLTSIEIEIEIELITLLFEEGEEVAETCGTVLIINISISNGVVARDGSSGEMWNLPASKPIES
ncbi:hypothetical protein NE237_017345 [Protea cynaroides]|uniref:Nematode resistance protein-like HSPRO1 N-terminal domain-containing protein n=1 Tax=Protea cynaroides TaxID=273540 RepID=A0A9Q0K7W1_9MAGN|nr:hypothetical protein NE237_017345 [Protea cynaroides]